MPNRRHRLVPAALVLALALAACTGGPAAVKPQGENRSSMRGGAGGAGQATPATAAKIAISGVVTAPAGVVSNNGGGILSNNGGSLISDKAGGLLGDAGGSLVSKIRYQVAQARYGLAALEQRPLADATVILATAGGKPVEGVEPVRTDANGRYTIQAPARGGPYRLVVPITTAEGKVGALATLVGTAASAAGTKPVAADVDYGSTLVTAKVVSDPAKAPAAIDNAAMKAASAAMTAQAVTGAVVDLADRAALEARAAEAIAATPELATTLAAVVAPPTGEPAGGEPAASPAPSAAPSVAGPASPGPSPTPSAPAASADRTDFEVGGSPDDLAAGGTDGSMWFVDARAEGLVATRLAADGKQAATFTSPALTGAPGPTAVAVDLTNQAWITHRSETEGKVYRVSAAGALAETKPLDGFAPSAVAALPAASAVWVVGSAWLGRFDGDGPAGVTKTDPVQGSDAVGNLDDTIWFVDRTGPTVVKLDETGARTVDLLRPTTRICPDGANGVWATGEALERIDASGTTIATFLAGENPGAIARAGDGSLWVGVGSELRHLSTAGGLIKRYPLLQPAARVMVSRGAAASQRPWVTYAAGTQVSRITP